MDETERRKWNRYGFDKSVAVKSGDITHASDLNDLSAGGASLRGKIEISGDIEISLDDFGQFPASLVRQWDTGFAVAFIYRPSRASPVPPAYRRS